MRNRRTRTARFAPNQAITAIVLGILALTGTDPLTLVLVALLSIGASLLVSGSTIAGRFFSTFH